MNELRQILETLEPVEALAALLPALKTILAQVDEEARHRFVAEMIGGPEGDKVSSMVDL